MTSERITGLVTYVLRDVEMPTSPWVHIVDGCRSTTVTERDWAGLWLWTPEEMPGQVVKLGERLGRALAAERSRP